MTPEQLVGLFEFAENDPNYFYDLVAKLNKLKLIEITAKEATSQLAEHLAVEVEAAHSNIEAKIKNDLGLLANSLAVSKAANVYAQALKNKFVADSLISFRLNNSLV